MAATKDHVRIVDVRRDLATLYRATGPFPEARRLRHQTDAEMN